MSEQENEKVEENVIQGPWPKSKRKVKIPDEDYVALQEKLNFAEELCQASVVQLIHTLGENGIDVSEKSFIRDMGLIIEFTKGAIYRSIGLPHVTQQFFESLVDLTIHPDNSVDSEVNLEVIEAYVELLRKDDDPDNAS